MSHLTCPTPHFLNSLFDFSKTCVRTNFFHEEPPQMGCAIHSSPTAPSCTHQVSSRFSELFSFIPNPCSPLSSRVAARPTFPQEIPGKALLLLKRSGVFFLPASIAKLIKLESSKKFQQKGGVGEEAREDTAHLNLS